MRLFCMSLAGRNEIIAYNIERHLRDGRCLAAFMIGLYALPLRNTLKNPPKICRHEFFASPQYYDELQELLRIGKAEGFELVRVGRDYDGGYVMLDDFGGEIAYSFGIAGDVSWDKGMASRGYDVYMYDHTIDGLPEDNPRFHWSKLGIADGITQDDRLKSLEELIALNSHEGERDMILKMDVEGAEWGFIEHVRPETLAQFGQITFEIHDVINPASPERILNALSKINMTHQLIHLHANNAGNCVSAGNKNFCSLLEVSYVLRDKYKLTGKYDVKLPIEIDMPNLASRPEVELGRWNAKAEIDGYFSLTTMI